MTTIKKNFLKSITNLIFINVLAKLLSVLAKTIIARKISTLAMSVYSLTLPTLTLLLNIAQLGIPTTISKLIAKKKYPTFKIMQVSLFVLLGIDLLIGIIYIFFVPTIANVYLKNESTLPTLYGMVLLLPLISLTSLLKGYFIGIDKVEKTAHCQISEELSRLLFIVIFVEMIDKSNISFLSFFAMFSTIIGEIASLIHLLISMKLKDRKILKRLQKDNMENETIMKNIMKFSLMSTSTRIIGSVIYFLEPIIYTYLMLKVGVSQNDLTLEYGIVNSYVFPLLLLPSFFANCISVYMLPKLSSQIEKGNYKKSKNIFLSVLVLSFFSGFICLFIIQMFPEFFSKILYGKVIGIEYIKKYSFLINFYFLQYPIHVALIAFDKEKSLLYESIICNGIRILCFYLLIPLYKTDGMIIAILISIYLSYIIHFITLFRSFVFLKNKSKIVIDIKTQTNIT